MRSRASASSGQPSHRLLEQHIGASPGGNPDPRASRQRARLTSISASERPESAKAPDSPPEPHRASVRESGATGLLSEPAPLCRCIDAGEPVRPELPTQTTPPAGAEIVEVLPMIERHRAPSGCSPSAKTSATRSRCGTSAIRALIVERARRAGHPRVRNALTVEWLMTGGARRLRSVMGPTITRSPSEAEWKPCQRSSFRDPLLGLVGKARQPRARSRTVRSLPRRAASTESNWPMLRTVIGSGEITQVSPARFSCRRRDQAVRRR